LLAYSLRKDALAKLKSLLDHPDAKTQEIAALAIAAIRERNHNIVKDPYRTGRVNWVVNPEDDWVLGSRT
jgi:hypothetical protein